MQKTLAIIGFVYFESYFPNTQGIPAPGTEHFVPGIQLSLGGAYTTAVIAQALGVPLSLRYPSGEGLADLAIKAALEQESLAYETWAAKNDPAVSLVYTTEADRAFVSSADFDCFANCPALPAAEWIHVVGLKEALLLTTQLQEAKERGTKVSVSASWAPQELATLDRRTDLPWDVFLLNRVEAEKIAGDVQQALSVLSRTVDEVIITLDQGGAVARIAGSNYQAAAEEVTPCDPSGAGDAFCAGYLAARLNDFSPENCLTLGNQVAAEVVQVRGSAFGNAPLIQSLRRLAVCK